MSAQTVTGPAPRGSQDGAKPQRGFSYAIAGAIGVTLVTLLIGGALFTWLILATRGPSAPQLIPADAQLYAALPPNVGGVVDVNQLQSTLRQGFGVPEPASLAAPLERLIGASILDDVATWLGSELAVAVRGADSAALQAADAGEALLRDGEVIFLFGSKNDPQAEAFLAKHRAAREARGAVFSELAAGDATIYAQEGGEPSAIAAFALIDHYVVFSNSAAALRAMAAADGDASLASIPAFVAFQQHESHGPVAIYTDGSAEAELVRAALRDLIAGLK
jgi:hypothetical protein